MAYNKYMKYSVRLCSDAFGIETELVDSREKLMQYIEVLLDSAEKIFLDSDKLITYRLCIDIGRYDDFENFNDPSL
jgi:hypothetical protein